MSTAGKSDLEVGPASLEMIAENAEGYRSDHFSTRVAEAGIEGPDILKCSAIDSLALFYEHYGFNRAGGQRAGYNDIAVESLRDVGTPDSTRLWREFERRCQEKGVGLNERVNRGVVEQTAELVSDEGNLFVWVGESVRELGSTDEVYTTIREIPGVGEKIARFFLRDAVWIADAEEGIPTKEGHRLQPVDIWVRRGSQILWPGLWEASDERIARRIASQCGETANSGIAVNQGLWYLGAKEAEGDVGSFVNRLTEIRRRSRQ